MNNNAGSVESVLGTFGGNVSEFEPTNLPEGASGGTADTDFSPGSVFTRAGRKNVYSYANLFVEKVAGIGQSLPGKNAVEAAWLTPNNVTLNSPPSYSSVSLNFTGGNPTAPVLDAFTTAGSLSNSTTFSIGGLTPQIPNEWAYLFLNPGIGVTITQPGWTPFGSNLTGLFQNFLGASTAPLTVSGTQSNTTWQASLLTFFTNGAAPALVQETTGLTGTFSSVTTAGNSIIVSAGGLGSAVTISVTDNGGVGGSSNTYQVLDFTQDGSRFTFVALAQNIHGGNMTQMNIAVGGGLSSIIAQADEITNLISPQPTGQFSQVLTGSNFNMNVPTAAGVNGLQVELSGHQTTLASDAILTVTIANANNPLSAITKTFTTQIPLADGTIAIGSPTENWGNALTPAMLNDPNLVVKIVASTVNSSATFSIYAVKLKAWLTPQPQVNFNWIKSYEQDDGQVDTLALDANGILWDENVTSAPGILNSISTSITPNNYAKSVTFDDVEYIAFSDLQSGADVPRLWNGQWLDRVSQVGPGAPPSFGTTSSGSNVLSITQNPQIPLLTGAHDWISVAAGHTGLGIPPTPGNVATISPRTSFVRPAYIKAGSNIVLSGFPSINGNNINNDTAGVFNPAYWTVASVPPPNPGFQTSDWITFQVPFTTYYNQPTSAGCKIQATVSTLTVSQQVPYLEVGNQFTLAGVAPSGWNNTFVVQATPNASQLSISQTSLSSNIANYVYTIITGSTPTIGQFVTVTGTLNGGGIFNVVNAVITAASPTQFSVSLVGANVSAVAETASGIISGTIFQFDPAGTVTNPIIGNAGPGGAIATTGVIGVGTRSAVCIFVTRNSAFTAPSPPISFNVTAAASAIVASQIPIGPPNVVQRILAFTGAGGANYFYIPTPVTVVSNGQSITYPATVVNDNTTTQITLSFPDAVLLAASAIDVQGNNLFEQIELGSSVGFLSYSSRLIAWGEQNKIQNLLNLSFDGGIGVQSASQQQTQPTVSTFPLGWTVDTTNGGGGSVIVSPIFGNSYYIQNTTGSPQAIYGMLEQAAYQDQFQVPIVVTSTMYSVRVTARCPSGVQTGNLMIDLFSPKLNQVFGSFTVPFSSMTTNMKIFTGTMLVTEFSVVPKDLLFRIYATAIPNNGDVEIDRVEPFPTLEPSFSTQFHASYVANPEAFAIPTGLFGPDQNQQPIRGALTLFDTLYALKTNSWYSTSDNGTTEPDLWNWREVSNRVGTIGSHSFDHGEEWAFSACRPGVYFFNGGEPLKISQEIQPVWDLINWTAGQSIWVRNDPVQKKLYVGIPITTPNSYMPEMPISVNPTLPNVVLMMNYRELNSGMAMADTPPIRSSYSGRLLAPEPARKWSFWNIKSPYADFINRANNQAPLFLCSGYTNSKVYTLDDAELDDDGLPINSFYTTYGFIGSDQAQQLGLGQRRMLFSYLSMQADGSGVLLPLVYPNSTQNIPFTLQTIPLQAYTLGDLESAVNVTGDRFFVRIGTNAVGHMFSLSKMVVALSKDPWSPIRGTQVGSY